MKEMTFDRIEIVKVNCKGQADQAFVEPWGES
jgi:hypothetical protein